MQREEKKTQRPLGLAGDEPAVVGHARENKAKGLDRLGPDLV